MPYRNSTWSTNNLIQETSISVHFSPSNNKKMVPPLHTHATLLMHTNMDMHTRTFFQLDNLWMRKINGCPKNIDLENILKIFLWKSEKTVDYFDSLFFYFFLFLMKFVFKLSKNDPLTNILRTPVNRFLYQFKRTHKSL